MFEALVLNKNFVPIAVFDTYISFIWTERYGDIGDFELHIDMSAEAWSNLEVGNYISIADSNTLMVIESRSYTTDSEDGDKATITGSSLESIFFRRVLPERYVITEEDDPKTVWTIVSDLIYKNVGEGAGEHRWIQNIGIDSTYPDIMSAEITSLELSVGTTLYDALTTVCELVENVTFKIEHTGGNRALWTVYFISGTDRSKSQSTYLPVVFSPEYENFLEGEFVETNSNLATTLYVEGEKDEDYNLYPVITVGNVYTANGLERFEGYLDCTSVSKTSDGFTMSVADYNLLLLQKGEAELKKKVVEKTFDGEGNPSSSNTFVYGVDYFLGDLVTVIDRYGNSVDSRIVEFIQTCDDSGFKSYPTFKIPPETEDVSIT